MLKRATVGLAALGLVAGMFTAFAIARCSTADAAFFYYRLGGKELPAGETREVEYDSSGTKYVFETPKTLTLTMECNFMAPKAGAYIAGGTPGISFMKFEWTSCSGKSKGNTCTEFEIETPLLRGEVVELASNGFAVTQFSPAEGEELIHFKLTCGGKKEVRIAKGSFLDEPSSQCGNNEVVGFFNLGTIQKVFSNKGGEAKAAETNLEGTPLLISGWTNLRLAGKGLKWGVC
jgi:hypothetical protein